MIKAEATVKWEKKCAKNRPVWLKKKKSQCTPSSGSGHEGARIQQQTQQQVHIVAALSAYSLWSSVQIGDAHTGFLYCFA